MATSSKYNRPLCALLGIVSPVPFAVLSTVLVLTIEVPEWIGPGVGFVAYFGIGWCASWVSGVLCSRLLVTENDQVCILLANSAGWMGLLPLWSLFSLGSGAADTQAAMVMLLCAALLSGVGYWITWLAMGKSATPMNEAADGRVP